MGLSTDYGLVERLSKGLSKDYGLDEGLSKGFSKRIIL